MIIAVDCDDTVAQTLDAWLALYNRDWGDSLTTEDCTGWDLTEFVKPECGVKIYDYLRDPSLFDDVQPIPGALQGVQRLREWGHRVVFVTATNRLMAGRKLKWLADHGFLTLAHGTNSADYVEAQDKSLIRADLLIDDRPKNCAEFRGDCLLFDRPHNRAVTDLPRAHDWSHVLNIVTGLKWVL